MAVSPVDWVPPATFDEYRLINALGRGSMGQVWLARDTVLDRLVAVKFIARLPAHDAVRRRFLTEARAAARVQHPNIIAIYRVGEIGPRPYLISEYVRGASLDKIARPVPWPRLLDIALGLARGLAAAHRSGVLHRDLKPANAILSETGDVKLLDFGLAKLLREVPPPQPNGSPARGEVEASPDLSGDPTLPPPAKIQPDAPPGTAETTAVVREMAPGPGVRPEATSAGAVMGTPGYMAPEMWRGEPATPRSDVYSLGALLYELGSGALPHRGDSPEAVRGAALHTDAPRLAAAAPGIDPRFAAIVDRCLRRDPVERFASGDEVCEAFDALAAGEDARPVRDRPRPRWVILVGAVGAALALVLFAYNRADREPPPHAGATSGSCPEDMVPVPAGTMQMGSPDGVGVEDEHPQHEVTLSAYCIDRTEVTMKAYGECVAARACSEPPLTANWNSYPGEEADLASRWCNRKDRPDHPINCVDWEQAAAYCTWKRRRLPTEAEWEYAARGNDGRTYPWGNEAPSAKRLNACGPECMAMRKRLGQCGSDCLTLPRPWGAMYVNSDGWETTAPVGRYPEGASPFGALDMAGNVMEWTMGWYGDYQESAEMNPQGARTGTSHVARGGGWPSNDTEWVRVASRKWLTPEFRVPQLGLRCARSH